MATSATLSLKGRALRYLAAREHSRLELARKLARHGEAGQRATPEDIERVLDELTTQGYLSTQRMVDSIVHRKASRLGQLRLAQELRQHGLESEVVENTLRDLQGGEFDRALTVWRRRFANPPDSPKERARQMRFLQSRGFSGECIHQVMRRCEQEASLPQADTDTDTNTG